MNKEGELVSTLPTESIDALIAFISNSKIIQQKTETIDKLKEIDRDLQHFRLHHSFRRKDWLPKVAH